MVRCTLNHQLIQTLSQQEKLNNILNHIILHKYKIIIILYVHHEGSRAQVYLPVILVTPPSTAAAPTIAYKPGVTQVLIDLPQDEEKINQFGL